MARARSYTKDDVNQILLASERRLSPLTNERGHCLEKHVGVSGLQISDRLVPQLSTSPTRPLIMGADGRMAAEPLHRAIWREITPDAVTKDLKADFRRQFEDCVSRSGSFLDLQQAIIVSRYVLNSPEGQTELAKLDSPAVVVGTKDARVAITASMSRLHHVDDVWKMNYAETNNDITHTTEFKSAFMLVDKLDADGIHIQTAFPVK